MFISAAAAALLLGITWATSGQFEDINLLRTDMIDLLSSTITVLEEVVECTYEDQMLGTKSRTSLKITKTAVSDLRTFSVPRREVPRQLRTVAARVSQAMSVVESLMTTNPALRALHAEAIGVSDKWTRMLVRSRVTMSLTYKPPKRVPVSGDPFLFASTHMLLVNTMEKVNDIELAHKGACGIFMQNIDLEVRILDEIIEDHDHANLKVFIAEVLFALNTLECVVGEEARAEIKFLKDKWSDLDRRNEVFTAKRSKVIPIKIKESVPPSTNSSPLADTPKLTKSELRALYKKEKKNIAVTSVAETAETEKDMETVRETSPINPGPKVMVSEIRNEEEDIVDESEFQVVGRRMTQARDLVRKSAIAETDSASQSNSGNEDPVPESLVIKRDFPPLLSSVTRLENTVQKIQVTGQSVPESVVVESPSASQPNVAVIETTESTNNASAAAAESTVEIKDEGGDLSPKDESVHAEWIEETEEEPYDTQPVSEIGEEDNYGHEPIVSGESGKYDFPIPVCNEFEAIPPTPSFRVARPFTDYLACELRHAAANTADTLPTIMNLCDQLTAASVDPQLSEVSQRLRTKAACVSVLIDDIRRETETVAAISDSLPSLAVVFPR